MELGFEYVTGDDGKLFRKKMLFIIPFNEALGSVGSWSSMV